MGMEGFAKPGISSRKALSGPDRVSALVSA
jgi:hypothetical protein